MDNAPAPFARLVEIGFVRVLEALRPPGLDCAIREGHRAIPLFLGAGLGEAGDPQAAERLALLRRPLVVAYGRAEGWEDDHYNAGLEISVRANSHDVPVEDFDLACAHYGIAGIFNSNVAHVVADNFNAEMVGRCTIQRGWELASPPTFGLGVDGAWVYSFQITVQGRRR
jgi:hypothetical protein